MMSGKPGPGGSRFAFVDAGEAARRLGVDRLTLDQWTSDGRLKAHRGVGKDVFYRSVDVETLYNELHPTAEIAAALEADERESAASGQAQSPTRKQQDPPMRVYLRLQADAKWYDISEEDILAWFQQLSPDGYERNKRNAEHSLKKLQYLVSLLDEGLNRK
ncbi:MAG TPA: helix-turn-helix domain-containing protein [Ktedonobacteraceae bacterium]